MSFPVPPAKWKFQIGPWSVTDEEIARKLRDDFPNPAIGLAGPLAGPLALGVKNAGRLFDKAFGVSPVTPPAPGLPQVQESIEVNPTPEQLKRAELDSRAKYWKENFGTPPEGLSGAETTSTTTTGGEAAPTNRIVAVKDPETGKITFVTENLAGGLNQVDYNSAIQELTGRDPRTAGNAFISGGMAPASFSDQLETMARPELSDPVAAAERQQWIDQRVQEERYREAMGDQARLERAKAAQGMLGAQIDPRVAEESRLLHAAAQTKLAEAQAQAEGANVGLIGAQTRRERAAAAQIEEPEATAGRLGAAEATRTSAKIRQQEQDARMYAQTPEGQNDIKLATQELMKMMKVKVVSPQLIQRATQLVIDAKIKQYREEENARALIQAGMYRGTTGT